MNRDKIFIYNTLYSENMTSIY